MWCTGMTFEPKLEPADADDITEHPLDDMTDTGMAGFLHSV